MDRLSYPPLVIGSDYSRHPMPGQQALNINHADCHNFQLPEDQPMYSIMRALNRQYPYSPPEHVATRHDITGVCGTLNDLDVNPEHFIGLAQMRPGEVLTSAGAADGYVYIIEREA